MSDQAGPFAVVGGMDGNIVRKLMDDPEFIARIEAVMSAEGSPNAGVAANVLRSQVAATPSVYNQYVETNMVSAISDAAIREGTRRNAYIASGQGPQGLNQ